MVLVEDDSKVYETVPKKLEDGSRGETHNSNPEQ